MKNVTTIAVLVRTWLARVKGQKTSTSSTIGSEYGLVRTATVTFLGWRCWERLDCLVGDNRRPHASYEVATSCQVRERPKVRLSGLFAIGRLLQRSRQSCRCKKATIVFLMVFERSPLTAEEEIHGKPI